MLIAVAGLIGAGKSTLVEKLDGRKYFEPVEGNPYLIDYYQDAKRWCFPMQIHLLHERYRMIRAAYTSQAFEGGDSILDRSIHEDWAFARLGYEAGYMSEREYRTYCRAHEDYCSDLVPFPDLMIYLEAPISTLIEHIRTRDRNCEAGVMSDYLEKLQKQYDLLIPQLEKKCLVCRIDATQSKELVLQKAKEQISKRHEQLVTDIVPRYRGGC